MRGETYCVYHPSLPITNFCRSDCCCQGLCAQCVSEHYAVHENTKHRIEIQALAQTYADVSQMIKSLYVSFGDNFTRLKDFYTQFQSQIPLEQLIEVQRKKALQIVEEYFDSFQKNAEQIQHNYNEYIEQQVQTIEQFIRQKNTEIDNIARKLEGEQSLKSVQKFLSSDFYQNTKQDTITCNSFIDSLTTQTLELTNNEAILYEIRGKLNSFLEIPNRQFFEHTSQFNAQEKKDLHPLGRFADAKSPYVYSQNKNKPILDANSIAPVQQNVRPVTIKSDSPRSNASILFHSFDHVSGEEFKSQSQYIQRFPENLQQREYYKAQNLNYQIFATPESRQKSNELISNSLSDQQLLISKDTQKQQQQQQVFHENQNLLNQQNYSLNNQQQNTLSHPGNRTVSQSYQVPRSTSPSTLLFPQQQYPQQSRQTYGVINNQPLQKVNNNNNNSMLFNSQQPTIMNQSNSFVSPLRIPMSPTYY